MFINIALILRIDKWYFVFNLPSDSLFITIASPNQKLRTSYNSGALSLQLSELEEKVTFILSVHFVPSTPTSPPPPRTLISQKHSYNIYIMLYPSLMRFNILRISSSKTLINFNDTEKTTGSFLKYREETGQVFTPLKLISLSSTNILWLFLPLLSSKRRISFELQKHNHKIRNQLQKFI